MNVVHVIHIDIDCLQVNDCDDLKVGWALYLAPSILNHSCVPNAEAEFKGKQYLQLLPIKMTSSSVCFCKTYFMILKKNFIENLRNNLNLSEILLAKT